MNKSLGWTWLPILMVWFTAYDCTSSFAGVTARDAEDAQREPSAINTPPATVTPSPLDTIEQVNPGQRKNKYVLRCWQNGVLIVERPTDAPPKDSTKIVRITGESDSGMRLFDLRNATCLLQ